MRRLRLVEAGDLPKRGVFGRDLALRDFRRYLGQSRDGLCYDASGGLFPNAFTALAGTVTDGHDLRLYLPPAYPDGDPDHRRLLDFGLSADGCADFFNARLRRFASNEMVAADVRRAARTRQVVAISGEGALAGGGETATGGGAVSQQSHPLATAAGGHG